MRYDKHGEELSPGLQVFAPGEALPQPHVPAATPRSFQPGRHPLDTAPALRRQVGRRITAINDKGGG